MIQVITKYGAIKAPAPASSSAVWGAITGTVTAQTDLTGYISSNYYPLSNPSSYISGITSGDVTTALGYTPEDVANKQNSLTIDGTGFKYPTVDAINSALVSKESFQTLTIVSSATPSIAVGGFNLTNYSITAQAVALTSITITGTPNNFDKLTLRITDNGVARAIALGTSFIAGECVIPTTTKISIPLTLMFLYDSVTSKYKCIFTSYDSGLWKRGVGNYSILNANDTTSSAAGIYSISSGQYANAGGTAAAAFGNSTVNGAYSIGSGYSCSASGAYSKVSGYACLASGGSSSAEGTFTVASGDSAHAENRSTTATGPNSHAGGTSSIALENAEWARSSAGTIGQYGIVDYAATTTTNTTIEIFIANASPNRLRIALTSSYRIKITALAKDSVGNVKEFEGLAVIKNLAGTTSLVGTCTMVSTIGDAALSTCAITITADNTNDTLKVEVAGIAATTINWYVKCDYLKLK